ncbi:hypothetical protein GCM10011515_07480 [Tsuneonella deserti]|uniref:Uncharacterized protein n=1 Tax=Tsuneonella deserti TaxID=2035528 RepID=A0ABQ1S2L3_9SPHN|nr:hypothetical protein [Tsuneonella deserti]GGD90387.1 hypothetical protein GCM10011515_07480 [Tsuneonella deserti]
MSPVSLAVRQTETALENARIIARARHGDLTVEASTSGSDLWVMIARKGEEGGLMWRVALLSDAAKVRKLQPEGQELMVLESTSPAGRHRISIETDPSEHALFVLTTRFRPNGKLHIPFMPRDLIAVGPPSRPDRPRGRIEARQRRLNTGLCYFSLEEPDLGKVLYLQDLTRLNPYFRATGTKPENAVGGEWPEVGYLPPTNPLDPSSALPGGRETVISRAYLLIRRFAEKEETSSAWQFLDMLGAIYRRLDFQPLEYRNWVERSERTLEDLSRSPKARTRHRDHVYFHPYTASENPDSMVQLSILGAVHEWSRWTGRKHPLERENASGLRGFYDEKLGALRRYLPDVSSDKDADAVDSWYLYHPMRNLGDLALDGDEDARELFFDVIDYGIKAAHHFNYKWPIQYKIDTFEVITDVAEADDLGQTDVGGMYAWVMLQAFQLSHEPRFLEEARTAIDAADGMRFDLNYQANLTAWGATACIELWRITGEKHYLAQSYVYLASFFHNCEIWESRIGLAEHYSNFLGATCLQDAPYMAVYECFDSFAAFERYLDLAGPDLIPSARLLVSEYCRYALDRAWYFYPDALPPEALASANRNGHIDRELSFPVEDLYPDGQQAGQVGQEIYGAGAAMVFATRTFHRIEGAPFLLHTDRFLRALVRIDERAATFALDGPAGLGAFISLVPEGKGRPRIAAKLRDADGTLLSPGEVVPGLLCRFDVPAQGVYTLHW